MNSRSEERTDEIVSHMIQYLESVLEKPHSIFGGLPICPFAKRARLQNKILYQVLPLRAVELAFNAELMYIIEEFYTKDCHEVMLVISPDVAALSVNQVAQLVANLNERLAPLKLVVFGGHPADDFNVQGVRTRQEPYINLTVQPIKGLRVASRQLKETNYYQNWSLENLQHVGFENRD
ncbi:hypothetical protein C7B65_13780 [Phormidesmis priestleyi ULC007]|uniref:DUF1415 domain-containing protein n=1 Tax=Phormidesmis priestleyi ULC007 TaxID=1920490 RepID=A0A2T1DEA2_9CYAN|nr:hypothetical protein [Phormidesmis priestleyi]PSB18840.1 hypothetical protein C7B65_13780 [Phormidesmis priestleyi ULC007]PZO51021.1 MAG: hypothetical protein DCF14_10035 [Phormidesmis priestleyi]